MIRVDIEKSINIICISGIEGRIGGGPSSKVGLEVHCGHGGGLVENNRRCIRRHIQGVLDVIQRVITPYREPLEQQLS